MRQHRRIVGLVVLATSLVAAGCGDDDTDDAGDDPSPSPSTSTSQSPADDRIEAVVVESFPAPDRPSSWLLVDITDGTTIEGESRLAVDAPNAELGCGVEHRPVRMHFFSPGEAVSFERVETDATLSFLADDAAWASAPVVGARHLRIACPPGSDEAAATLATQRATWEAANIDSYEYTVHWGVFSLLGGDYRARVVDGQPAELRRIDGAEDVQGRGEALPRSIDEVFDVLERELAADRIDAQYDDALGYPVDVLIDRIENADDDELVIRISDFTVTG
jgi:hypothetical protein